MTILKTPYPAVDIEQLATDIANKFGSARQAALAAGLAESTVRRILYGEFRNPTSLVQLAHALGYAAARYRLDAGHASRPVLTLPRRRQSQRPTA